jgi:hypothetical protein
VVVRGTDGPDAVAVHGPADPNFQVPKGGVVIVANDKAYTFFDWCLQPYEAANHPPIVRIRGDRERAVAPGEVIVLNASDTTDPDGDRLAFDWSEYPIKVGVAEIKVISTLRLA